MIEKVLTAPALYISEIELSNAALLLVVVLLLLLILMLLREIPKMVRAIKNEDLKVADLRSSYTRKYR